MTRILSLYEYEAKETKSQYKGVHLNVKSGKWYARLRLKGQKPKYGGAYFNDELDAAKKANQLCEELGIPLKNPEISGIPNQQVTSVNNKIVMITLENYIAHTRQFFIHIRVCTSFCQ